AHDKLQEQQGRFGGLVVVWEVALDTFLLFAAEGRVGKDHIDALLLADLRKLEAKRVTRVDLRRVEPVQQQVHLAKKIRKRFRLAAGDGRRLKALAVRDRLDLLLKVIEGLHEEAAGAARGIEHGFAKTRIGHFHHEAY